MAPNPLALEARQMLPLPEADPGGLPEGHLAHFDSDRADSMGRGVFQARDDEKGPRTRPFHASVRVKALVQGDATGVFGAPASAGERDARRRPGT